MPKGPQGRKRQPDSKKIRALLRESEVKLRQAADVMIERLKEPKYPASKVTERQKAYRTKHRKALKTVVDSLDRRAAKRKGSDA
jgi:hypothetical protein